MISGSGGPRSREQVRDEILFHIEMRVRELESRGMDPAEARRAALEAFGDPDRIEADVVRVDERIQWRRSIGEALGSVAHDIRYAARYLTANPVFTAVAVGTLALGIGATTAIFSLVDAALLRRPAVADPESLVAVYTTCRLGEPRCSSSYPDYLDYRERAGTLADVAAATTLPASLGDEERGARLLRVEAVTGNYFTLLGLDAARGRLIRPDDDVLRAGAPVAVLSHTLWRDQFGGDPGTLGSSIRLNGTAFQVIGVTPESYRGLSLGDEADLWIAMQTGATLITNAIPRETIWEERGSRWISRLVGRLETGSTVDQAREELLAVSERLRQEDPDARGPRSVTIDPIGRYLPPVGAEEALPQFVWLLMGVVGATLLLACANLANLLLARATTRTAEMGVRVAIGAGRLRLVRQLVAESVLLSGVGTAAGILLAPVLMSAVGSFELPGGVAVAALDAGLDARVLAVASGLAMVTAMLCGLVPALHATRRDVVEALRTGRSPESRRGSGRLRQGLVAAQVAICVVLLVGSGLFLRSLRSALATDPGFRSENLAIMRFSLALLRYTPAEGLAFAQELRERALANPRVRAAAVATLVPFQGSGFTGTFTEVEGYQPAPGEEMRIDMVFTSPAYLETLGIPLLAGREFGSDDSFAAGPVAIVNRAMADRYWAAGDAVGGTMSLRGMGRTVSAEVVGVAGEVRWSGLRDEPRNFVFVPHAQWATFAGANGSLTLVARTTDAPDQVLAELRREGQAMEPGLSPQLLATMDDLVGDLLMPQRLGTVLLSGFGLLALLLAAIGIAGVVSYTVREQRRSIGVRLALGARRGHILRMVVRGMAGPVALGLGVGVAAAALLDDAVERFLYGVVPGDPLTYVAIAAGLSAVALAATLVPAREATRVDPLRVLRSE